MNTMKHFEDSRIWVKTLGGIAVFVALYAWIGDDEYQAAVEVEALRQTRAASLAVSMCLPRGDQRTTWYWSGHGDDARLHCRVEEADGTAPRTVLVATPAGLDRLALYTTGAAK